MFLYLRKVFDFWFGYESGICEWYFESNRIMLWNGKHTVKLSKSIYLSSFTGSVKFYNKKMIRLYDKNQFDMFYEVLLFFISYWSENFSDLFLMTFFVMQLEPRVLLNKYYYFVLKTTYLKTTVLYNYFHVSYVYFLSIGLLRLLF